MAWLGVAVAVAVLDALVVVAVVVVAAVVEAEVVAWVVVELGFVEVAVAVGVALFELVRLAEGLPPGVRFALLATETGRRCGWELAPDAWITTVVNASARPATAVAATTRRRRGRRGCRV